MTMNGNGHNWDEMGIVWEASEVSRQVGENRAQTLTLGNAQIPRLTSLAKAIAAGLETAALAGVNGTSWRVTAQDVARRYLESCKEQNRKPNEEYLRDLVYSRLRGLRTTIAGTVVKRIVVRNLPGGGSYEGDDENDYRQQYAAALVDMGIAADSALAIAISVKW